jgi:glycosyltransferase involved in cell wall biosynthesis
MPGPLRDLWRIVRDDPPDLIVSNTASVTIGAALSMLCRKPHVWFIKECLDTRFAACRSMAAIISRFSSAVVVPSKAVARSFRSPVHVLPDGSDVAAVLRSVEGVDRSAVLKRLDLPPDRPVVAQVGGIVHWKGQHITAESFVQLKEEFDRPPCSLLFLGDGDEGQKRKVTEILDRGGPEWAAAARFVRFAPDDFSFLHCADFVVHPSVLPDPYPNAVREAMILGKPVIGSNAGGVPELIDDGRTGLLATPEDARDLAAKTTRLLRNRDEREKLGSAAREHARANFDIRTRKDAFLKLFQDLVN